MSDVPTDIRPSAPLSADEVADDSDEEVYCDGDADDEAWSDGEVAGDGNEKRLESSDEDEHSGSDAETVVVTNEPDETLKYEIVPTPLGDCGCVSTGAAYKKRYAFNM